MGLALGMSVFLLLGCAGCTKETASGTGAQLTDHRTAQGAAQGANDLGVRRAADGSVTWLEAERLSQQLAADESYRSIVETGSAPEVALAFLQRQRELFRLQNPRDELRVTRVDEEPDGKKHVRLAQSYAGVPVWAAEIIVHVDEANQVYLVNGRYVSTPRSVDTQPVLSAATARLRAAASIEGMDAECAQCRASLVIFAPPGAKPRLAYRIEASSGPAQAWEIQIDAVNGDVLGKHSTVRTGGLGPIRIQPSENQN